MTQLLSRSPSALATVPYSSAGLLSSLPSPSQGRTGWPWTEETAPFPPLQPNGQPWPKISIVTPSYNQGEFIEETIRSVLLQNYPNLEYIVIDGGSTDNTVAILEKYSDWLSLWCSEKDNGQSHAINKGFHHASGGLRGYLNSDDVLLASCLKHVTEVASAYPEKPLLILGDCEFGDSLQEIVRTIVPVPPINLADAVCRDGICPQPAAFWTKPEKVSLPEFGEQLTFCMDYEFWCDLIKSGYEVVKLDQSLAFYRYHLEAKGATIAYAFWSEMAGLSLLRLGDVRSFEDKLTITAVSRRRIRHYLRLEIQKIFAVEGRSAALKALYQACKTHPDLLTERITLGLARRLLFSKSV